LGWVNKIPVGGSIWRRRQHGQELRGKAGVTITGNGDFDLAEVATDGLGGMA